jgi:hypothetical protein
MKVAVGQFEVSREWQENALTIIHINAGCRAARQSITGAA